MVIKNVELGKTSKSARNRPFFAFIRMLKNPCLFQMVHKGSIFSLIHPTCFR